VGGSTFWSERSPSVPAGNASSFGHGWRSPRKCHNTGIRGGRRAARVARRGGGGTVAGADRWVSWGRSICFGCTGVHVGSNLRPSRSSRSEISRCVGAALVHSRGGSKPCVAHSSRLGHLAITSSARFALPFSDSIGSCALPERSESLCCHPPRAASSRRVSLGGVLMKRNCCAKRAPRASAERQSVQSLWPFASLGEIVFRAICLWRIFSASAGFGSPPVSERGSLNSLKTRRPPAQAVVSSAGPRLSLGVRGKRVL